MGIVDFSKPFVPITKEIPKFSKIKLLDRNPISPHHLLKNSVFGISFFIINFIYKICYKDSLNNFNILYKVFIIRFGGLLVIFFVSELAISQTFTDSLGSKGTIIEIDSITNRPKQSIPFDNDNVTLKAYVNPNWILSGTSLFKLDKYGRKVPLSKNEYNYLIDKIIENRLKFSLLDYKELCKACKIEFSSKAARLKCKEEAKLKLNEFKNKRKSQRVGLIDSISPLDPISILNTNFKRFYNKGEKNAIVFFDLPPLEPGSNYSIELDFYTLEMQSKLLTIFRLIPSDQQKALDLFLKLQSEFKELTNLSSDLLLKYFKSSINEKLSKSDALLNDLESEIGLFNPTVDTSSNEVVPTLIKNYIVGDSLRIKFGSDSVAISFFNSYSNYFVAFDHLNNFEEQFKSYLNGGIPIQAATVVSSQITRIKRLSNIRISILNLSKMIEVLKFVKLQHKAVIGDYEILQTQLEAILEFLKEKSEPILSSAIETETEIIRNFHENNTIYKSKSFVGTSNIYNFHSKNKFSIVPDFGFLIVYNGGNFINNSSLIPYLGFNVNFRPLNKDIPFKDLRFKTWRHRLSFMSGVSLISLNIDGKREDFFSSTSLITGLGFRLTNEVKLVGGTVWFKAKETHPFSDRNELGFSPFVGVSVDLELKTLFGGIAELFTFGL